MPPKINLPGPSDERTRLIKAVTLGSVDLDLAKELIENNPGLINATDPSGHHILELVLLKVKPGSSKKSVFFDFLLFVITQPNFDPSYHRPGPGHKTNIQLLIFYGQVDLIKAIRTKATTLFDETGLYYNYAKTLLENREDFHREELRLHPKKKPDKKRTRLFEHWREIVSILRDETIKYAIRERQPNILDGLRQARCNLNEGFGPENKGPTPFSLLIDSKDPLDKPLKDWFELYQGEVPPPQPTPRIKNPGQVIAALFGRKKGEPKKQGPTYVNCMVHSVMDKTKLEAEVERIPAENNDIKIAFLKAQFGYIKNVFDIEIDKAGQDIIKIRAAEFRNATNQRTLWAVASTIFPKLATDFEHDEALDLDDFTFFERYRGYLYPEPDEASLTYSG